MINIGREAYPRYFFERVINAFIPALAKFIKKEFTGIAIYSLINNIALFGPVFSDAQRKAAVPVTVAHCANEQAVIGVVREPFLNGIKLIIKFLRIKAMVTNQVIDKGASIKGKGFGSRGKRNHQGGSCGKHAKILA